MTLVHRGLETAMGGAAGRHAAGWVGCMNHLERLLDFQRIALLDILQQQQQLLTRVTGLLPAPLDERCIGAQSTNNRLILHTDSPLWANRLRFQAPALLEVLRQQGLHFSSCQVRVLPPLRRPETRRGARLSTAAARQLDLIADDIGNADLSQALHRLARRSKDSG